jgi:salicylate hydroxylase
MALEDALVLSRLLLRVQSEADVRAAFKGYDAVRRPRNRLQIETAHQAARVLSFREEGVLADIGKIKEQMEHRWDWIWGLDLEQHIREAEEAALRARAEMA